jgi:hypothetical protein
MPIEKEITLTREITQEVTETKVRTLEVSQFTIRCNGPDAGELFGHTNILEDGEIVGGFDWVVPKEQALAVGVPRGLYAQIQKTLYGFTQVTTPPAA